MIAKQQSKNSGIKWAPIIPNTWEVVPTRRIFNTAKKVVGLSANKHLLLGLTTKGVVPRGEDAGGKHPASYDTYQEFKTGELVMCLFDNDVTPRTVGYIKEDGMMTGAYTRLIPKEGVYSKYYYYYYLYLDERKELLHLTTGLRNSISKPVFWSLPNPLPPIGDQKRIADYLNEKTKIIDQLIERKEKLIELLREKRSTAITQAVTTGLDANVKMKPSGVEWLDKVPEDWKPLPLKFLFEYQSGGVWGEDAREDSNDIVCIRVADFDFENFSTKSANFTYRNIPEIKTTLLLNNHSILLEKSGGGDQQPVGRAVRYGQQEKATCSNFIQKLQVANIYNPDFVILLFSEIYNIGLSNKAIKKTTGIQNLDLAYFLRNIIFLPSDKEQIQIVNTINRLSARIVQAIAKLELQIAKLKEYQESLIHSVVTGKINV